MSIENAFKMMNKLNDHVDQRDKYIESVAKTLIQKDELVKQYERDIANLKRENLQLINRGTVLEVKLNQMLNNGRLSLMSNENQKQIKDGSSENEADFKPDALSMDFTDKDKYETRPSEFDFFIQRSAKDSRTSHLYRQSQAQLEEQVNQQISFNKDN